MGVLRSAEALIWKLFRRGEERRLPATSTWRRASRSTPSLWPTGSDQNVSRPGTLLVVDYVPPFGDRPKPMVNFVFDGGIVTEPGLIRIEVDELDGFEFFTWQEAATKLPASTSARIPAAREARKTGQTIYLPAAP